MTNNTKPNRTGKRRAELTEMDGFTERRLASQVATLARLMEIGMKIAGSTGDPKAMRTVKKVRAYKEALERDIARMRPDPRRSLSSAGPEVGTTIH